MIQILLCDDDHQIRAEIEKQINNQILICQYDMQIAESTASPSVLLNHLKQMKQRQNLYFLDVVVLIWDLQEDLHSEDKFTID